MSRSKAVADRIRAEIPIVQVLHDYGYHVDPEGEDREQQFSCDLHGSGRDRKPSARVYPESSSFHCFGCGRSRDAITLVREKENVEFWQAVRMLEQRYGLAPLPWEGPEAAPDPERVVSKVEGILHHTTKQTAEQILERVSRMVDTSCRDRSATPEQCAAWWEARDKIAYMAAHGDIPADIAKQAALRVLNSVREFMGVADGSERV